MLSPTKFVPHFFQGPSHANCSPHLFQRFTFSPTLFPGEGSPQKAIALVIFPTFARRTALRKGPCPFHFQDKIQPDIIHIPGKECISRTKHMSWQNFKKVKKCTYFSKSYIFCWTKYISGCFYSKKRQPETYFVELKSIFALTFQKDATSNCCNIYIYVFIVLAEHISFRHMVLLKYFRLSEFVFL